MALNNRTAPLKKRGKMKQGEVDLKALKKMVDDHLFITTPLQKEGKMEDDEDDLSVLRRMLSPGLGNILNVTRGDFSKVPSQEMMQRLDKLEKFSEDRHYGTIYGTNFLGEDVYKTTRHEVFFTKFISDDVKEFVKIAMAIETKGLQAAEEEKKDERDVQQVNKEEEVKNSSSHIITNFISDNVKALVEIAMAIEAKGLKAFKKEREDEHDEAESSSQEEEKKNNKSLLITKLISAHVKELVEKGMAIETNGLQAAEKEQEDENDEEELSSREEEKKNSSSFFFTRFISDHAKELIKKVMAIETKGLPEEEQEDEHENGDEEEESSSEKLEEEEKEEKGSRSLLITKFIIDDVKDFVTKRCRLKPKDFSTKNAMANETKGLQAAEEEQKGEHGNQEAEEYKGEEKSSRSLFFTKFISDDTKELIKNRWRLRPMDFGIKKAMAVETIELQAAEEAQEDERDQHEAREEDEEKNNESPTKNVHDPEIPTEATPAMRKPKDFNIKKSMLIETIGLQAAEDAQEDEHDKHAVREEDEEKNNESPTKAALEPDNVIGVPTEATPAMRKPKDFNIKKSMLIETRGLQAAEEAQEDEHDKHEAREEDEEKNNESPTKAALEPINVIGVPTETTSAMRIPKDFGIKKSMLIETRGLQAAEEAQEDERDEPEAREEDEEKNNESPTKISHEPDNVIGIPTEATPAMRKAFSKLCTSSSGVLFENQLLQVNLKHEYTGCQGKVQVFFRNLSGSSLTTFKCYVDQPEHLALNLEGTPGLLESGCIVPVQSQAKLAILVEVKAPFDDAPVMIISFESDGGRHVYALRLPIVATCFMDPLVLDAGAFIERWKSLDGHEKECQQVFTASQTSTPIDGKSMMRIARIVTEGLKFRHSQGCDPTPWTVSGAATFRTGAKDSNGNNINVDCLVRVEANPQAGAYRVTTRSLHPICSKALKNIATISIKLA